MAALEPYYFGSNMLQFPKMIAVKIVKWVIAWKKCILVTLWRMQSQLPVFVVPANFESDGMTSHKHDLAANFSFKMAATFRYAFTMLWWRQKSEPFGVTFFKWASPFVCNHCYKHPNLSHDVDFFFFFNLQVKPLEWTRSEQLYIHVHVALFFCSEIWRKLFQWEWIGPLEKVF